MPRVKDRDARRAQATRRRKKKVARERTPQPGLKHLTFFILISGQYRLSPDEIRIPGEHDMAGWRNLAADVGIPANRVIEIGLSQRLRNLREEELEAALIEACDEMLRQGIGKGDQVFLMYTGHGAFEDNENGKNRFVLRMKDDVDFDMVLKEMLPVRKKGVRFFQCIDACHSEWIYVTHMEGNKYWDPKLTNGESLIQVAAPCNKLGYCWESGAVSRGDQIVAYSPPPNGQPEKMVDLVQCAMQCVTDYDTRRAQNVYEELDTQNRHAENVGLPHIMNIFGDGNPKFEIGVLPAGKAKPDMGYEGDYGELATEAEDKKIIKGWVQNKGKSEAEKEAFYNAGRQAVDANHAQNLVNVKQQIPAWARTNAETHVQAGIDYLNKKQFSRRAQEMGLDATCYWDEDDQKEWHDECNNIYNDARKANKGKKKDKTAPKRRRRRTLPTHKDLKRK